MRVIESKKRKKSLLLDVKILQKTMIALRGKDLVPKGVYRFKTFAEANEWMIQNIVSTLAHRSLKTS